MSPHEQAFHAAYSWLFDFQRGWDATPSTDTLDEARRDFLDILFNGGSREVQAVLS